MKNRIIIRGIDRTDDHRVVCPKCKRDMGGTVNAIPGHKVRHVICEPCKWGSYDNFLADWKARMTGRMGANDNRRRTI